MKKLLAFTLILTFCTAAQAELDTFTYVSHDGGGNGEFEGDISGVGAVTLLDADEGDMWNGGDQFAYVHDSNQYSGNFTATVRVVSQTEAIDGRWGKAGIRASATLDGTSANAMAQVATGNGSQVAAPAVGDHSPVPARLGGRTQNDGNGGFEDPILDSEGAEVPNNVFASDGTNVSWLSLSYDAGTNGFVAGIAPDNAGSPGAWSYSDVRTDIQGDGDWYLGLGYSAHGDLNFDQITHASGLHGVTFDNFSVVPEPASMGLIAFGLAGLLGFRRRNRQFS